MMRLNNNVTKEQLLKFGFREWRGSFIYFEMLDGEVSFNLSIRHGEILRFEVLDEDFLQPYDYEYYLQRDANHGFALMIQQKVNAIITRLQDAGILQAE